MACGRPAAQAALQSPGFAQHTCLPLPARLPPLAAHLQFYESCAICWDHFAFRSFGVPGLGIASLSQLFTDLGYAPRGPPMVFPAKKLEALWFSPPHPALPRMFISELKASAGPGRQWGAATWLFG